MHFQSGHHLTRPVVHVVQLLRDSAMVVGLPHHSLKGHSFRIGAAPTAAAAVAPGWLITVLSRWSSECCQLYIRTPKSVLHSVSPKMASVIHQFLHVEI